MQDKKVRDAYNAYFYFNNERTLSTDLASELFSVESGGCSVFVDKTRKYDNQIIIHEFSSIETLESYLSFYTHNLP
ncbi:hypothetical protein ACXWSJ_09305, partial [Streptococcus pyogenes]